MRKNTLLVAGFSRLGHHPKSVGFRGFTASWESLKWRIGLSELHLSGRTSPGIDRCLQFRRWVTVAGSLTCAGSPASVFYWG